MPTITRTITGGLPVSVTLTALSPLPAGVTLPLPFTYGGNNVWTLFFPDGSGATTYSYEYTIVWPDGGSDVFDGVLGAPSPTPTPTPRPGYRITAAQVQAILDFDPSITNLTPFIAAAEQLVDRVCANSPGGQETGSPSFVGNPVVYSAQELATIETWLAAHFVAIRDPLYASTSMGPASKSVIRSGGMNLAQTPYGQQAMLLDMNGGLAWLDKHISQGRRARAGIVHLGHRRDRWLYFPWRFYALGTG